MKRYALLFAVLVLAMPANAQVIDRADILSQVDVEIKSFLWTDEDGNPGSAQPDFSGLDAILNGAEADFTTMVENLNQNVSFVLREMSDEVPLADSFATATHVQEAAILDPDTGVELTTHFFFNIQQDEMTILGSGTLIDIDQDGQADEVATRYLPDGWEIRDLPLSVGNTWETVFDQVSWVPVPGFGLVRSDGTHEEREYEVLGTTTLTTPAGSAPAIVLHLFEEVSNPNLGLLFAREQYSFIAEGGLSVEVAFEIDPDTRQRLGINDIAYFEPQGDSGTAVEQVSDEMPNVFTLGQNYPNPFNPATVIPFEVQHPAHVSLTVYDALGRAVATLADRAMASGSYTVDFDAADLPSGVYFYQLRAGDVVRSRAMLLNN